MLRSKGGDDTAETLLEHARQHDLDLIATGTQAHTALDRHLTGSVSTALLRRAQRAVLMSPPKEASSSAQPSGARSTPRLLDQPPPLRVCHRLEAVVGPELQVDVVQVVAERLWGNTQLSADSR